VLSSLQRLLAAIAFVVVVAAGFLFAWFNDGLVRFDYVAGAVETRFAFVVFGALAVGCLFGLVGGFAAFLRQRREAAHLRTRIQQLESELDSLRAAAAREIR
jgi:uncharacterized integral membrane protein